MPFLWECEFQDKNAVLSVLFKIEHQAHPGFRVEELDRWKREVNFRKLDLVSKHIEKLKRKMKLPFE